MSSYVSGGLSGLHYCEPRTDVRREYRLISHIRVASHRLRESRLIRQYREQVTLVNERESWASNLEDSDINETLGKLIKKQQFSVSYRENRSEAR